MARKRATAAAAVKAADEGIRAVRAKVQGGHAGVAVVELHPPCVGQGVLALEAGIPVEVVAERLGHSVAVCGATYRHVMRPMASGAAEKVAGLIFGSG